jgi:hypothetical protein
MRALLVLSLSLVSRPARADYQVNLVNTTALSATGETIRLTGGGTFDPDAQAVRISGTFTVVGLSGITLRRGTWRAHQLDHFTAWKGPHELGGILDLMATLMFDSGGIDQQRMRLVCTSNKPPTVGEDEGVSVGSFLEHEGGMVQFRKK